MLQAALLSIVVVSVIGCRVVVRWLGGSFAFFCLALCVGKKMQMCHQMCWQLFVFI